MKNCLIPVFISSLVGALPAPAVTGIGNLDNLSQPDYPGSFEVQYSYTEVLSRSWWGGFFHVGSDANLDTMRLKLYARGEGDPRIRLYRTAQPIRNGGFVQIGTDPVDPTVDVFPEGADPALVWIGDLAFRGAPPVPGLELDTYVFDYTPDSPLLLESNQDYVFLLMTDPVDSAAFVFGDSAIFTADPTFEGLPGWRSQFYAVNYIGNRDPDWSGPQPARHWWRSEPNHAVTYAIDVTPLGPLIPETSTFVTGFGLAAACAGAVLRQSRRSS